MREATGPGRATAEAVDFSIGDCLFFPSAARMLDWVACQDGSEMPARTIVGDRPAGWTVPDHLRCDARTPPGGRMARPEVLDFTKLLGPIPGDNPAGSDLRADPSGVSDFYVIRDARKAASEAERKQD